MQGRFSATSTLALVAYSVMDSHSKLRFLHIPKTAGTSFNDCLFALYPRAYYLRRVFVFHGDVRADVRRLEALPGKKRDGILLYTGHGPLEPGIASLSRIPTVTFLRDPVARVASLCQHFFEGKSPEVEIRAPGETDAIDALLDSGEPQLSNMQARALLGDRDYQLPEGNEAQLAERASQVLEHDLQAFGITEEFDLSLLLFQRALGWQRTPRYRYRNTGSRHARLQFSDRQLDRIGAMNSIDLRIYTAAKALFYRRVTQALGITLPGPEQLRRELTRPSLSLMGLDAARGMARFARSKLS